MELKLFIFFSFLTSYQILFVKMFVQYEKSLLYLY